MKKQYNKDDRNFVRTNEQIRISPIRVVKGGEQLGVMPTAEALKIAKQEGLDLVEIAPNVRPPVCSIMDHSKFKYEQKMKEKEQRQKQKKQATGLKELRLRPKIATHDVDTKINAARKFLGQGKKVQLNLIYKSRELAHKDEGFKVMDRFIEELKDIAEPEIRPKLQGNRLICKLEPKK